jgi:uncharacterized protein (TIGR00299 family) protein
MRISQIECFAGISGDMLLGALIDASVPAELLQQAAASLGIGAELRVRQVHRSGIQAVKVDVLEHGRPAEEATDPASHRHTHHHDGPSDDHPHNQSHQAAHVHGRNWPQIRTLIAAASIPDGAKRIAQRAFELLALAEAKIHGIAPDAVHFHEVGAVDTITDIVCAAVGLDSLKVSQWRCTPVNVGSGFVDCAHGRMPVPAPATAELLQGIPTYAAGPAMELTTPTGAAMLRALDCTFDAGAAPFEAHAVGYGAGGRDPKGFANVLRLSVGVDATLRAPAAFSGDSVVVLECALDDATPQVVAHAMELALEHGALDTMAAPVTMKKGRLGTLLTVLCRPGDEASLQALLFRETTTLGIRRREEQRVVLERAWVTVETSFGRIRVKVASGRGEFLNAMPEYEDCRRAAREHAVPLRTVMEAASAAYAAQSLTKVVEA